MEFDPDAYLAAKLQPVSQRNPAQDFDPDAYLAEKLAPVNTGPGILSTIGNAALSGLETFGKAVDSVGGAPTRTFINDMAQGQGFVNSISNAATQFGADPTRAPTGQEVAKNLGLSEERGSIKRNPLAVQDEARAFNRPQALVPQTAEVYSPAQVAGVGIDLVADPLNFIPVAAIAKVAGKGAKGAKTATGFVAKNSVKAIEAATDTSFLSRTGETVSRYGESVADSVKNWFNPKVAPDFPEFQKIAADNGIDPAILPETVEFGAKSRIAKKAKQVAEGPAGAVVEKRFLEAAGAAENAFETRLAATSGGKVMSPADTGQFLAESYNKAVKQFFEQDFVTYDSVVRSAPGANLTQDALKNVQSKITGLRNKAKGRLTRGFGGQQEEAASILKDLDVFQRSLDKQGNMSLKRANDLLKNLGEEAFKKYPIGTKIPTDQKALQEVYFSLRESIVETVAHTGGQKMANELAMSNQIMSDFLKENGRIKKIFDGDLARDEIFKKVQGFDLDEIDAMKSILPPEDFNKFKGAYINSLVIRNAEGGVLWKSSMKKMAGKADHIKAILDPEEAKGLADIMKLGDRIGDPILNTSSTNVAERFNLRNLGGEILSGGADMVGLEELKATGRGKGVFSAQSRVVTPAPATAGKFNPRNLPISSSKYIQASGAGRVSANQETNEEIKKRKRAISGANK